MLPFGPTTSLFRNFTFKPRVACLPEVRRIRDGFLPIASGRVAVPRPPNIGATAFWLLNVWLVLQALFSRPLAVFCRSRPFRAFARVDLSDGLVPRIKWGRTSSNRQLIRSGIDRSGWLSTGDAWICHEEKLPMIIRM